MQTTSNQHLIQPSRAPTVTVIMPCYNSAATIRDSITSVKTQTMKGWELIVVDDGSSDNSTEIVNGEDDPRIKLIKQMNGGVSKARNRGLNEAQGQYIAFLDSDDTWERVFLERMLAALTKDEKIVLVYCGWKNVGLDGGAGKPFIPPDYEPLDRAETFLGGCRWPIHGVVVRKSVLNQTGGFDETLRTSEDYDLWLRVVLEGKLALVPEVLAHYVHHEGPQITKKRTQVALDHIRAQEKFVARNPDVAQRLGKHRLRVLIEGELLRRAYNCYWDRDLQSARILFRHVMRRGYGRPKDWLRMLPALLPLKLHARLIEECDRHG